MAKKKTSSKKKRKLAEVRKRSKMEKLATGLQILYLLMAIFGAISLYLLFSQIIPQIQNMIDAWDPPPPSDNSTIPGAIIFSIPRMILIFAKLI